MHAGYFCELCAQGGLAGKGFLRADLVCTQGRFSSLVFLRADLIGIIARRGVVHAGVFLRADLVNNITKPATLVACKKNALEWIRLNSPWLKLKLKKLELLR